MCPKRLILMQILCMRYFLRLGIVLIDIMLATVMASVCLKNGTIMTARKMAMFESSIVCFIMVSVEISRGSLRYSILPFFIILLIVTLDFNVRSKPFLHDCSFECCLYFNRLLRTCVGVHFTEYGKNLHAAKSGLHPCTIDALPRAIMCG